MDETMYVVVDYDGQKFPYLAEGFNDALQKHSDATDAMHEVEGIFGYGSTRVGLI
ncbi:hypothetical protein [Mycobacterium sp. Root265]|uniref:hypothetical protein n=1 Tax=Mycobacterium sp. Root265 TaxID=1736504 RepID=UPI000AF2AC99|nr:hypothetical protein [Mycobacterium sp. Root265]